MPRRFKSYLPHMNQYKLTAKEKEEALARAYALREKLLTKLEERKNRK